MRRVLSPSVSLDVEYSFSDNILFLLLLLLRRLRGRFIIHRKTTTSLLGKVAPSVLGFRPRPDIAKWGGKSSRLSSCRFLCELHFLVLIALLSVMDGTATISRDFTMAASHLISSPPFVRSFRRDGLLLLPPSRGRQQSLPPPTGCFGGGHSNKVTAKMSQKRQLTIIHKHSCPIEFLLG